MPTEYKPKRRTDRDTIAYAEFTGLRNDVAPESFDASDLAVATNVNIDKARRISRRAGATRRIAATVHSLWSAGDLAFCVADNVLCSIGPALLRTPLRTGMTAATASYARVNDAVYFSDGARTGVVGANLSRTWGLVVPLMVTSLAGGDLVPGLYGFAATYSRDDGQESGACEPQFFSVAAGQSVLVYTDDSRDVAVNRKNIYMTQPNGEVLFLVASVNIGQQFTPTAAAVAAMNLPLETEHLQPPPAGQLVAYYKGCMFVAVGDTLYPSKPFAYELFDPRDYIPLDGEITMLAPIEDRSGESSGFFIGTTKSCGVLSGGGPDKFEYTPKTHYGAVKGALAFADATLYLDGSIGARALPLWLTTQGVCVGLPNLEVNNLTRSHYSFPVSAAGGAAMFDPDTSTFVAASGAGVIVLQVENMTLTSYTSYAYNSFTRFAGKNLGADASGLHEMVGDTDNGLPIAAAVVTGTTDFGSTFVKALDRLYVGYRSTAAMTLSVKLDDKDFFDYTLDPTGDAGIDTSRVKTGKGLAGRYWQFGFKNIGGAMFSIDTIDVKSMQLQRRINGRA